MTTNQSAPDSAAPADAAMGRLLREARSPYDPDGLRALLKGVLGAPAEIGTEWHRLVADPMPPALAQVLEQMQARDGRRLPRRSLP